MHKTTILLSFLIFLLSNCTVEPTLRRFDSLQDSQIPSEILDEILILNDQIYDAIQSNNPQVIQDNYLDFFMEKENIEDFEQSIATLSTMCQNASLYSYKNLYVTNSEASLNSPTMNMFTINYGREDAYQIKYHAISTEVFVSLNRIGDQISQGLLTLIYSKIDGEWKLNYLHLNTLKLYKKTAIDYHKIVKHYDELGYVADAAAYTTLVQLLLKPAGEIWTYEKEQEMVDLNQSVNNKIQQQYQFPLEIESIPSKPQLLGVYLDKAENAPSTIIQYYSDINIYDTLSLEQENLAIREVIGDILKGIDKDKELLFYEAQNIIPKANSIEEIPSHRFIQTF